MTVGGGEPGREAVPAHLGVAGGSALTAVRRPHSQEDELGPEAVGCLVLGLLTGAVTAGAPETPPPPERWREARPPPTRTSRRKR